MSIRDEIDRAAERGARPFLHFGERTLSFAEYAELAGAAGGAWAELGIGPGDRAAVLLPNSPEYMAAFHGLASIGGVMVPLNTHYRPDEAAYLLEHSEATVVLTTPELLERTVEPALASLGGHRPATAVLGGPGAHRDFGRLLDARLEPPRPDLADDEVAVILYTSGTTGRPKGSLTPHEHFVFNGRALSGAIDLGPDDVHMTVLPLFHQNAEATCTGALVTGCRLVLEERFSRSRFWSEVHRYGVTHAGYLGSIIPLLDKLDDPLERDNPLRVMWGAGLSAEAFERLERRWEVELIEVFGMTETGLDLANTVHGVRKPGSCGLPVPGKDVRVVDEDDAEVPPGTAGQIVVGVMPAVTRGYLKNPEATAEALRGGWMHTGDMAKRDEEGYFYFLDRYKDIIRRSGENISSADVEAALRAHPSILDAACVPVPDEIRDEEVKAVVVLREGGGDEAVGPDSIRAWCAERLAEFKVPRYVEYRSDLQRTATGKVQKHVLRSEHGRHRCWDAEAGRWIEREAAERA